MTLEVKFVQSTSLVSMLIFLHIIQTLIFTFLPYTGLHRRKPIDLPTQYNPLKKHSGGGDEGRRFILQIERT